VPVVAIALLVGSGGPELESVTIRALLSLLMVIGFYIFVGNSGVVSFGHVAFIAIGAYVCGLVTMPSGRKEIILPNLPGWLVDVEVGTTAGILLAGAFTGALGYIVAVPLMRLSGIGASIATLALLAISQDVLRNWRDVTAGPGALAGIPTDTTLTRAIVWVLIGMTVAFLFQKSRVGLRLRASREDALAARAVGIRIYRERRIAFALSAAVVGIGGALYGHFLGAFTPDQFWLPFTFLILAMLVVGGIHSLAGAVVGTAIVSFLTEALDRWEANRPVAGVQVHLPGGARELIIAMLLIGILALRPGGITNGRELPLPFKRSLLGSSSSPTDPDTGTPIP
jgi:branched-chain amino acid transport system permease protein